MKVQKTSRGFQYLEFKDANGNECSIQQSSAVGDYEDSFDNPGSSFLWLGIDKVALYMGGGEVPKRMHLNRDHVKMLVDKMTSWLEGGMA